MYLRSGGLWVSGSRQSPLRRAPVFWVSKGAFPFSIFCAWGELLVLAGKVIGIAGLFCRHQLGDIFRSLENFPATGISPESFLLFSSGEFSPVLLFGVVVVSGQPRLPLFFCCLSDSSFPPASTFPGWVVGEVFCLLWFSVCPVLAKLHCLLFDHVCLCESGREGPGGVWG